MTTEVILDFETASAADLKKVGGHRYAEDPTTEIICLDYKVPYWGESVTNLTPADLIKREGMLWQLAHDEAAIFVAHGAGFEKAIWRAIMVPYFCWPDIPNERWDCTMASAAMHALPLDLDKLTRVLGLPEKDTEGSKITRALSKASKKDGSYDRSLATLSRVYAYCGQDVIAEDAVRSRLGPLPAAERATWLLDQRINERGVFLDMEFVRAAQMVVDRASVPLQAEFRRLTGVEVTQRDRVLDWVRGHGVYLPDMRKETLVALLGSDIDGEEIEEDAGAFVQELPAEVRRALEIRQLIGSAAIKKLKRMEACVCSDGRARGLMQYHSAASGRWGGRLFQPHNFPVGTVMVGDRAISPDLAVSSIMTGDPEYVQIICGAPPVQVVVGSLRHAIIAESSRELTAGDFSGVEARILLALAGQEDKAKLMADGADVYCDMAAEIYRRPIDKERDPVERDIGKHAVLGLGYGMGKDKFKRQYAKEQTLEFCARVVSTYREEWAPCVPKVWYGLENAAVRTVLDRTPNEAFGVRYAMSDQWLTARLPSGRLLWYFNPQRVLRAMPWDATDKRWAWTYQVMKTGQFKTVDAFGGLLTGNTIQAIARDLMVHAMHRCERENLPVILTVHDEIIAEPEKRYADPKMLKQIMEDIPSWARELKFPIAVKSPWAGPRYRK